MDDLPHIDTINFPKGILFAFVAVGLFIFPLIVGVVVFTLPGRTPEAALYVDPCTVDFNSDGVVSIADQDLMATHLPSKESDGKYHYAYDLNRDKFINSGDQVRVAIAIRQGQGCEANTTVYTLSGSATGDSVTLNWSPGLKLISKNVYTQIYYGDMTGAKTDKCDGSITGSYAGTLISSDFPIKQSPALSEGQTTYTWTASTSNYAPQPGRRYCLFMSQSSLDRSRGRVASNYFEVTTPNVAPSCRITPSSVHAGQSVNVTSAGGLFGTIGMASAFGTLIYPSLGDLHANGTTTVMIPAQTLPGTYVIRVGGFGVVCTPNILVSGGSPGGPPPAGTPPPEATGTSFPTIPTVN